MAAKKFRHKATEVFAVYFSDMKGTIDLEGFPIDIKVEPLIAHGGRVMTLNAFFGPLPVFVATWTDYNEAPCRKEFTHDTVIVARIREYHGPYRGVDEGKLYLDFIDFDTFFGTYEEVK